MKPLSFRTIGLASAIALSLLGTVGVAQTAVPSPSLQRPVRVVKQLPAQEAPSPILVLPPQALRQTRVKAPLPVASTNLKLLTDAEKLAMVSQFPGHAATLPTGVMSSAVLTPMEPYLRNQATIVEGGEFNGLRVNGESSSEYPPHWYLGGKAVWVTAQFLPFQTGKLTFVVFHVAHLNAYRNYEINGYKATAVDGKVVFAVTPDTSSSMWVSLSNAHADQMTLVTSVEIFVVG